MITFITLVIILAVAGYVAYKIGAPKFEEIKEVAEKAPEKIEPIVKEVREILEKAEITVSKKDASKKVATENKNKKVKKGK